MYKFKLPVKIELPKALSRYEEACDWTGIYQRYIDILNRKRKLVISLECASLCYYFLRIIYLSRYFSFVSYDVRILRFLFLLLFKYLVLLHSLVCVCVCFLVLPKRGEYHHYYRLMGAFVRSLDEREPRRDPLFRQVHSLMQKKKKLWTLFVPLNSLVHTPSIRTLHLHLCHTFLLPLYTTMHHIGYIKLLL